MSTTASTAFLTFGNATTPTRVGSSGARRIVTSVMMPRVPSAPINSFVMSGPAELLRERWRVLRIVPSGSTAVTLRNHSARAVPYRTELVPLHPVPIMPPIVAFGPGSRGRNMFTPRFFSSAFSDSYPSPACTTTSPSLACTARMLSIRDMLTQIPPYG